MFKHTFFVLLLAFTLMLAGTVSAQSLQEYTWKEYGVNFSIPTTHKIIKNTDTEFESGDKLTWLQMFPYKDASETAQGMITKVVKSQGLTPIDEGSYETGGFQGYWITCNSDEHPEWSYWYIGFIDPNSDNNFYAIIWFKKDHPGAHSIAEKMSTSFAKDE